MREKLFGFQEDALSDLHKRINSANSMLLSDAEEQVIISFSAPTGERVIIVTGCINVLVSRVSGTLTKYNSCIA